MPREQSTNFSAIFFLLAKKNRRIFKGSMLFLLLPLLLICIPLTSFSSDFFIREVVTNGNVMPDKSAEISFLLSSAANLTIEIYDPDYTIIRHLVKDRNVHRGTNSFFWDGKDDTGTLVPNEAYYFVITAKDTHDNKAVYNSMLDQRAGANLLIDFDSIVSKEGEYTLYFTLPEPSRVSIRAGIHNGPLLKTIVDWKVMSAGSHNIIWDGRDDMHKIQVMDQNESVVYIRAMALPGQVILMSGSNDNYPEYHRSLSVSHELSKKQQIAFDTVQQAAITSQNKSSIISDHILRDATEKAPVIIVYAASDRSIPLAERQSTLTSGVFNLSVEVDPLSLPNFQEIRYETVIFIDNIKYDEEENAYAPFIYPLDTRALTNGKHNVTVNLTSMSGQIGSYSFTLDVINE